MNLYRHARNFLIAFVICILGLLIGNITNNIHLNDLEKRVARIESVLFDSGRCPKELK